MLYRILVGLGLAFLGYYLGREVSRTQPVRVALRTAPAARLAPRPQSGRRPESLLH